MTAECIFWVSAALIFYVYAGYPLLLWSLGKLIDRPVKLAPIEPFVSLLVAAYNEDDVIESKIRNARALDYPPGNLEIVIASDGSTDRTEAVARTFESDRIRVLGYPVNRGKLAVLNDSVPKLRGDIVVFSDASSMLAPDAIRRLAAHFADAEVGAVSGVYRVRGKDHVALGKQEDFYWRYETFLKIQEARLGSVLGCHGSLYAIRKSLYPFPPVETINDDYIIPLRILQQGYRVSYEPASVAYEDAHEMGGFTRRVRIMTGNVEQLRELKPLLSPLRPLPLFFFLSHKAGRLVVPLAMLTLIAANVALIERPLYQGIGLAQALFYALVLAGALSLLKPGVLRLPYYFCMINAAAMLGIYHSLAGKRSLAWKTD